MATRAPIKWSDVLGGFALAVATLWLGAWLNYKLGPNPGTTVFRVLWFIAAMIVVKVTFTVGRARGFPVRDEAGGFSTTNLMRNAVAAVIAFFCVVLVASPVFLLIARSAR